jgi:hypothetical protein
MAVLIVDLLGVIQIAGLHINVGIVEPSIGRLGLLPRPLTLDCFPLLSPSHISV